MYFVTFHAYGIQFTILNIFDAYGNSGANNTSKIQINDVQAVMLLNFAMGCFRKKKVLHNQFSKYAIFYITF